MSRSLIMALGALAIHGTWALLANFEHGTAAAVRAFGTQGALSVVSTFVITLLMERLIVVLATPRAGFVLAVGTAVCVSATMTVTAHWLAGTPNLALTAVGPIYMGSFYCVLYGLALIKLLRRGSR